MLTTSSTSTAQDLPDLEGRTYLVTGANQLVRRHLEIRRADRRGIIRMVPSDGPRSHGLMQTLSVIDELWAARDDGLYLSFRSALAKRPDARLLVISTADSGPERPLVRLRERA